MKKQDLIRKNVLFWTNMAAVVVSLVWTVYVMWEIWDDRSFGGFGSLFLMLVLSPYLLALGAALMLLALAAWTGRRVLAGVAAGLQIVGPILWLWFCHTLEAPFSPFEVMMTVCAAAGEFLLLSLPAVRPTKNGK